MIGQVGEQTIYRIRRLPKDVGVAVVVAVALLLGFLLGQFVIGRTQAFTAQDAPISLAYPSTWITTESLIEAALLKVEDPSTPSAFKTTMTVESRELDPANPPTMQMLLDQRVEQRQSLTGYHFLSNSDATVGGQKATQFEYAYVVQPLDQPRRASLPIVVVAREYIVVGKDRVYYITFAAPENEFLDAGSSFARIVQSVQVQ